MSKKTKAAANALVVLTSRQIGSSANFDLKAVTERMRSEMKLIRDTHAHTALRALRIGIVLHDVKAELGHGKFMPWVKKTFCDAYSHRTATDYMRLARYFVEKTCAKPHDVAAIADSQLEVTDETARGLLKKAIKFIGDKTVTELIAEASSTRHEEERGEPGKPIIPDEEQLYLFKRDELGGWLAQGEALLLKENALQYIAPKSREEALGFASSLRVLADKVEAATEALLKNK